MHKEALLLPMCTQIEYKSGHIEGGKGGHTREMLHVQYLSLSESVFSTTKTPFKELQIRGKTRSDNSRP